MCRALAAAFTAALLLAAAAPATTGPAPPYAPWGFDLSGADLAARPGDGFFRYANGAWLDRTPIPADRRSYSVTAEIIDKTERDVTGLVEAAAESDATHVPATDRGKVGAFYRAFMDTRRIEALGIAPLVPTLARIHAATTPDAIAALMGHANEDFTGTPFGATIEPDQNAPAKYAVYLAQPVLGMPDRGYYLDAAQAGTKAKYRAYVATLLRAGGWAEPDADADKVVALETAIAEANWTPVQQRDLKAGYTPVPVADLPRLAPGFPWGTYLGALGAGNPPRVVLKQGAAARKLAAIFAATPVATWRAWLAFTALDHAAPYLSATFADAFFDFHDRTLTGITAAPPRWKRAVHTVSGGDFAAGDRYDRFGTMGWAVGELYARRYFPPEAKIAIEAMVVQIRAAYRARVAAADWMSAATKAEALRKLDTYRVKVGYPSEHRDYSALVIRDDDLVGDVRRAAAADWAHDRARLERGVTGREWGMTPQTVDAYHGLWLHEIVFPAAILQAPIFNPRADAAVNYGAIGATIAHEITHGLDDQGRNVDATGRLRDWWTVADAAEFKTRSERLAAQFSTYEALPGLHVDGHLALGESLADLLGLSVALDAYHASLMVPAPVLDGMTGDQRFFLGSAQFWRGKVRPEATRRFITDPHPPRVFRTDGIVRNVDGWYAAFGVRAGDRLYLAPRDRVRVW